MQTDELRLFLRQNDEEIVVIRFRNCDSNRDAEGGDELRQSVGMTDYENVPRGRSDFRD